MATVSREQARTVLVEELSRRAKVDLSAATDETNIREDVPVDSLGLLDVFLKVEQRLGVELDDDALGGARTIGDLVDRIVAASGGS